MSAQHALDPSRDRWFLGTLMHFHTTARDSASSFSVIEQTMPKDFSPPRHVHAHESAVIFVLEGALTVEIGGEERVVGASDCVFLPKGIPHSFRADLPSRILEVTTPGGAETFYAENGVPAERLGLPPPAAPDISRLAETAKSRGIDLVGPPMSPRTA